MIVSRISFGSRLKMVSRLGQHPKAQDPASWLDRRIFRDYWILHLNMETEGERRLNALD